MTKNDSGYARLRAALDEAHTRPGVNNSVHIQILGENAGEWDLVTGDHVERDGTLHPGGGFVVFDDSTCVGTRQGAIEWRGGHTMPDGERLERFLVDRTAMTVRWTDARAA